VLFFQEAAGLSLSAQLKEDCVSIKDQFTEEEWEGVLQSPMLAGLAVTAADPGGLWSAIKEGSALARSLVEAKASGEASSLLTDIGAAFETSDGRRIVQDGVKDLLRGKRPAEAADAAVARLGEIGALVAAKAPEQAAAYKEYLRVTAQKVAEAGMEGGFLGFGGEKVSEAEKRTLADIDEVLG
jgi:hypothetical protein